MKNRSGKSSASQAKMNAEMRTVVNAVRSHQKLFADSLPMIASENVTSRTVRAFLSTDLSHRYAEGSVGGRFYQGCEFIDVIEESAIKSAKKLFRAEHVNVQPISGMNANLAAFLALTEPGDRIISLTVPKGGHISHAKYSTLGIRGLEVESHPFDFEEMNIDADAMVKKIKSVKPKVVVFGASMFLFPHPVLEAREVCDEVGAKIVYDGAHVLGLIAGGRFQDPLREGADAVTGSTHKTFPGPQGGIILCKKDIAEKVDYAVYPGTVSNHHLHHIAALAICMLEMLEFGKKYAAQIVQNAKSLAQELYELGFDVLCEKKGFTESHQVVMNVSGNGGGSEVAERLERANIIANKNLLPWDNADNAANPSGLRLGVQELTRIGMKKSEMTEVANFLKRIILDGERPEKVGKDVIEFKKGYQSVCYSFDDRFYRPGGAYAWDTN
jgi:glycine hydroxymethyltransferase